MKKCFPLLLITLMAVTSHATVHIINAGSYYYNPSSLTISVGDTVEWINDGGLHDVNANINSQTSMSFNNPVSFQSAATSTVGAVIHSQVFSTTGTYNYDCSIGNHAAAGMVGSITVTNTIYDVVSNSTDHTTLKTAIDLCGLDGALSGAGPFTLFAPTDAAFNLLPAGLLQDLIANVPKLTNILKHHVLTSNSPSGSLSNNLVVSTLLGTDVKVTINSSNSVFIDNVLVSVPDISADNGVVHVIDAVLIPPTIYDIVSNSADHTTLKLAIDTCSLDGVLSGSGPFTLFAPTDAAFDLLPAGTLASLLNDLPQLTNILKHHVVGDSAVSTSLSDGQAIQTLNLTDLTVNISMSGVMIDNSSVTKADIIGSNGVVHVIDAVLIPSTSNTYNVSIIENDEYLYSVNILGKYIKNKHNNQLVLDVYKSGNVIKRYIK